MAMTTLIIDADNTFQLSNDTVADEQGARKKHRRTRTLMSMLVTMSLRNKSCIRVLIISLMTLNTSMIIMIRMLNKLLAMTNVRLPTSIIETCQLGCKSDREHKGGEYAIAYFATVFPRLPLDSQTHSKTSTNYVKQSLAQEQYYHFGVTEGIKTVLANLKLPSRFVELQLKTDGWPILGMVKSADARKMFVIGLILFEFLNGFKIEMEGLLRDGLLVNGI